MERIEMEIMVGINAGDKITAACTGLAVGEVVFGVGVAANFWNPVGWVGGAALILADAACILYAAK